MVELLTEIWKSDASNLMFLINLVLIIIVGIIAWQAFKYFLKDYNLNVKKVDMLITKSNLHDSEHLQINERIESLLNEQKLNRESDRTLLMVVAKEVGIELPMPK